MSLKNANGVCLTNHMVYSNHSYLVLRLLVMLYIKLRIRIARADEVAWG